MAATTPGATYQDGCRDVPVTPGHLLVQDAVGADAPSEQNQALATQLAQICSPCRDVCPVVRKAKLLGAGVAHVQSQSVVAGSDWRLSGLTRIGLIEHPAVTMDQKTGAAALGSAARKVMPCKRVPSVASGSPIRGSSACRPRRAWAPVAPRPFHTGVDHRIW